MRITRSLLLAVLVLALATTAHADHHASEPAPPAQIGKVSRSAFSTAIENREPIDDIASLSNDHRRIFFFSELTDLDGQTVSHRWEREGQVMADVPFEVRGPRWRVWSTKQLQPSWTGQWSVSVVDGNGRVIESRHFSFIPVSNSTPAPGEATARPQTE